jgi:integrase
VGPRPPQRRGGGPTEAIAPEITLLAPAEARTLLEAARGNRLGELYVLAVTTGMRQGELLGLGWEDVDLGSRTVRVRRTLTLARGGPRLTEPKAKSSRRSTRLTASAVEALDRHRERQEAERAASNGSWAEQGLMFTTRIGTPIRRAKLHLESWKPLLRRAGLPDTRFHDLRHTCATLLLTKGVHTRIVSEMSWLVRALLGFLHVASSSESDLHNLTATGLTTTNCVTESDIGRHGRRVPTDVT